MELSRGPQQGGCESQASLWVASGWFSEARRRVCWGHRAHWPQKQRPGRCGQRCSVHLRERGQPQGPWQGGDNMLASATTVPEAIVVSKRGMSGKVSAKG